MKSDNEFLLYYYDETAAKEAVVSLFLLVEKWKKINILITDLCSTFKQQNANIKLPCSV